MPQEHAIGLYPAGLDVSLKLIFSKTGVGPRIAKWLIHPDNGAICEAGDLTLKYADIQQAQDDMISIEMARSNGSLNDLWSAAERNTTIGEAERVAIGKAYRLCNEQAKIDIQRQMQALSGADTTVTKIDSCTRANYVQGFSVRHLLGKLARDLYVDDKTMNVIEQACFRKQVPLVDLGKVRTNRAASMPTAADKENIDFVFKGLADGMLKATQRDPSFPIKSYNYIKELLDAFYRSMAIVGENFLVDTAPGIKEPFVTYAAINRWVNHMKTQAKTFALSVEDIKNAEHQSRVEWSDRLEELAHLGKIVTLDSLMLEAERLHGWWMMPGTRRASNPKRKNEDAPEGQKRRRKGGGNRPAARNRNNNGPRRNNNGPRQGNANRNFNNGPRHNRNGQGNRGGGGGNRAPGNGRFRNGNGNGNGNGQRGRGNNNRNNNNNNNNRQQNNQNRNGANAPAGKGKGKGGGGGNQQANQANAPQN